MIGPTPSPSRSLANGVLAPNRAAATSANATPVFGGLWSLCSVTTRLRCRLPGSQVSRPGSRKLLLQIDHECGRVGNAVVLLAVPLALFRFDLPVRHPVPPGHVEPSGPPLL